MFNSLHHYGLQPTRLLCPQDSPGKNYWSGWPCSLSSRGYSRSRDQPAPLMSPALAGGFFTTSATRGSLLSILYEANFIYSFIYLFFGSSGSLLLHMRFSCNERGLLFMVVSGLLIEMASLIVEHRLQPHQLQQLQPIGSVVVAHMPQLLHGMWYLPRPGIKPASLDLQDVFLTTLPPGKLCAANFESCLRCLKTTINIISWINFYTNNRLL